MEKVEYLREEEWRQLHTELLQSTLNRLYQRVPFYRELFEKAGVSPEDLEEPKDLTKFPLTTRDDLSAHYPYDLFAVPLKDITRLYSFPWLPNPIVKGFTERDVENIRLLTVRFLSACGLNSEDILLIYLESGMWVWTEELKEAAELVGATVIPPSTRGPEVTLRIMKDFRATVVVTTPSLARVLYETCKQEGISPPKSLRLFVLVGEGVSSADRTRIEEFFGVDTRLGYGIAEVLGPGMAYECEKKAGLHLAADYLFPEVILDQETGKKELVITTLNVRATPLLRFRTGDLVELDFSPCGCGRTTPRIVSISQKPSQRISYRGVKVYFRVLEGLLERTFGTLPSYRISLKGREPHTELLLELVMEERLFRPSIVELHEEAHRLERAFFEFFGVPCRVKWVERLSV